MCSQCALGQSCELLPPEELNESPLHAQIPPIINFYFFSATNWGARGEVTGHQSAQLSPALMTAHICDLKCTLLLAPGFVFGFFFQLHYGLMACVCLHRSEM